jgi:acetyl esterase/lipase
LGWIPGELPLQVGAVELIGLVAFALNGALRTWPGWVGSALVVASCGGLVGLAVVAHRSRELVDAALDHATGGAIDVEGFERTAAWNRWWRLVIAVPFRWRGIRRARNIDYWGDGNYRHKLDILTRRSAPPERAPVLVYIHGGAWVMGDKRQQGIPMMHELVQRGWVCVAINYRLSPRATWPAHIVDCKRAVAWVRQHIAEYGGDPGFIAVSGGSAGGHLSSLLALTPNEPAWQPGFEDLDTSADACVPFYGVYDMTGGRGTSHYDKGLLTLLERRVFKRRYDDDPSVFRSASPLWRVNAQAPPFFVVHGTHDTLVPVAEARRFVEALRAVSVAPVLYAELPYTQHAFDVLPSVRSAHAVAAVVRFLEGARHQARLRGPGHPPTAGDQATSDLLT